MLTYNNKKEKRRNNLLIFLLLFFSGNPLALEYPIMEYRFFFLAFILIIYAASRRRGIVNNDIRMFYIVTAIIFLFQIVSLHYFSYPAAINFLATATCGILVARIIGQDFRDAYFRVMYVLCIISLIGQALYTIGLYPGVFINQGNFTSIIVHNVKIKSLVLGNEFSLRNSGMFWEPGAFQGYIMLTFLMYLGNIRELWARHKKKCIVILITVISTFSTTAYIALGIIGLYIALTYSKNIILKALSVAIVIYGTVYVYKSNEFMEQKIMDEIEYIEGGGIAVGRIGSATIDWHYIKKHPIIGNSLHNETRYSEHLWFDRIRSISNGFTDITAKMGIVFILMYLVLIYKRLHKGNLEKLFTIILIVILLQGECFFNYPLFFALPFIIMGTEKQNYKRVRV